MVRSFAIFLVLFVTALSSAQLQMRLLVQGKPIGDAQVAVTRNSSGGITTTIKCAVKLRSGGLLELTNLFTADRVGRPLRAETVTKEAGRTDRVVEVYGVNKVTVTRFEKGKKTARTAVIPKGNIADPTNFWFILARPKLGASVAYQEFDSDTLRWQKASARYVGWESVPGTKLKGHRIRFKDGEQWVDDKGQPIRMDLNEGGVKMVLVRR